MNRMSEKNGKPRNLEYHLIKGPRSGDNESNYKIELDKLGISETTLAEKGNKILQMIVL